MTQPSTISRRIQKPKLQDKNPSSASRPCRDASTKTAAVKRFAAPPSLFSRLLPTRLLPSTAAAPPAFAQLHPLVATIPDEPADIFYENLGVSALERAARRASLQLLRYFVILLAFVATSAAVSAKQTAAVETVCIECGIFDGAGAAVSATAAQLDEWAVCAELGASRAFVISMIPMLQSWYALRLTVLCTCGVKRCEGTLDCVSICASNSKFRPVLTALGA